MAETEKEGQTKPKFSRRKELIYTQVEIKDTHTHTHTHTHTRVILWKDKQNWSTFSQTHHEKEKSQMKSQK